MDTVETLRTALDKLAQERDELRVKARLAGMEVRDEWDKAEARFEKLQHQGRKLTQSLSDAGEEAADSGRDVWAATKLLADEVGEMFKRVGAKLH